MSYQSFSVKVLEKFIEPHLDSFKHMKLELQTAGINLTLREYLSVGLMSTMLTLMFSLIFFSLVFSIIADTALLGFFTGFSVALFFTILICLGFYVYPGFVSRNRKKKIELSLPFATTYMATISGSGATPTTMFKLMAQFNEYGEFSKEIRKIVRDIQVFGYDLQTAIKKTTLRTPSEQFKDLMGGVLSSITSGYNLTEYLQAKSKSYLAEHKRKLQEYSKQLSLYVEIYLTLIIVGSIFFMVLSTIMSVISVSGSLIIIQFMIVFVLMPIMSVGFIYLLKSTNPTEV